MGQSWQCGFKGVIIRRQLDSPPLRAEDGELVVDNTDLQVIRFSDFNIIAGTTYYYTAFAYDNQQPANYATGISASATPILDAPPHPVTEFSGEPGNGIAKLSWVNPSDTDLLGVKIIR